MSFSSRQVFIPKILACTEGIFNAQSLLTFIMNFQQESTDETIVRWHILCGSPFDIRLRTMDKCL